MQTIEIRKGIQVGMEDLINGVSKMETPMLEKFMDTLGQVLAVRKTSVSTEKEKELLLKIENLVPAFVKRRYKQLHIKLQKETISEPERQELLQIVQFAEEKGVERVYLMAELSALCRVSLEELIEQLRSKRYANAKA